MLASVAQRHLSLAPVDTFTRSVPVIIAVTAYVFRTIGEAATLAAGVHLVRTVIPAAQVLLKVAALRLFPPLHLGGLRCLGLEFIFILGAAQPADRRLNITMYATEVTATDDTLGRRSSKAYSDRAFTS
jgi:hypothetical protein